MMKVEPSPPWRSIAAWMRLARSASTTSTMPILNARDRTCDVWNASSSTTPEHHADDEASPEVPVLLDRDEEVEHDEQGEQQAVAVAAREALGVALPVEVEASRGGVVGHPTMLAPLVDDDGDGQLRSRRRRNR